MSGVRPNAVDRRDGAGYPGDPVGARTFARRWFGGAGPDPPSGSATKMAVRVPLHIGGLAKATDFRPDLLEAHIGGLPLCADFSFRRFPEPADFRGRGPDIGLRRVFDLPTLLDGPAHVRRCDLPSFLSQRNRYKWSGARWQCRPGSGMMPRTGWGCRRWRGLWHPALGRECGNGSAFLVSGEPQGAPGRKHDTARRGGISFRFPDPPMFRSAFFGPSTGR